MAVSELYAAVYRDRCQAEHVARVYGGTVVAWVEGNEVVWRIYKELR